MSSGTGADVTLQEANDLLHKWDTESTKLLAVFSSDVRVTTFVSGFLRAVPDGRICVSERGDAVSPAIFFDLSLVSSRKYGDSRAFTGPSRDLVELGAAPRLTSALVFGLSDGSQLALFEVAENP